MTSVIGLIAGKIAEILENRDSRLDHLPLTSPLSVILVVAGYLYFVKRAGPAFMSKREPFTLDRTIIIYNLAQIILNTALFLYGLYAWYNYRPDFNLACQPIDWGTNVLAIMEAQSVYYFYCLKILDLCDTAFFILKKNDRQVTFLHVYHHFLILIGAYRALAWSPGGHFLMLGLINSFVHVIMYTYYMCSVFRPELKKNVQLKKIVTSIQIAQFLYISFYLVRPLLNPDCPLPKFILFEALLQNVVFLGLFVNFYYRNYYCVKNVNKKL